MALFMQLGQGGQMCMADDGQRMQDIAELIIVMFLTMLAVLKKEGMLKSDSEVRNLKWVIEMYLRLANVLREQGLLEGGAKPGAKAAKTFVFKAGNFEHYLREYATEAGITLEGQGAEKTAEVMMPKDGEDPWKWKNGAGQVHHVLRLGQREES
jgi:hypothetical protein